MLAQADLQWYIYVTLLAAGIVPLTETGARFHASVTAAVGPPAHPPAEHGCASGHRAMSCGCPCAPHVCLASCSLGVDLHQGDEVDSWE